MLRLSQTRVKSSSISVVRRWSSTSAITGPSYDTLSSHQFSSGTTVDAPAQFDQTLQDLNQRLKPLNVPAKFRHLVFRPKNAAMLHNITVTDKAGNRILSSEVVTSKPSGKILSRLIRQCSLEGGEQNIEAVLEKFKVYARYYPKELQPAHVCSLLRAGARASSLYPTIDYVMAKLFFQIPRLVTADTVREILRLYSVRAATLAKKESSATELEKLWHRLHKLLLDKKEATISKEVVAAKESHSDAGLSATGSTPNASLKDDLQANLIMVYGLAPRFSQLVADKENDAARALVGPYLSAVSRLLLTATPAEIPVQKDGSKWQGHRSVVRSGLRYAYTDYVLGKQGIESIAKLDSALVGVKFKVDTEKLDALVAAAAHVFDAFGLKLEITKYVENAAKGLVQETQRAREKNGIKDDSEVQPAEEEK